jgi:hypothetical protein
MVTKKKRITVTQTDELTAAIYGNVDDEVPLETWLRRHAELSEYLLSQQEDSELNEASDPADIVERKLDGMYD